MKNLLFVLGVILCVITYTLYKFGVHCAPFWGKALAECNDYVFTKFLCSTHPRRLFLALKVIGISNKFLPKYLREMTSPEMEIVDLFVSTKKCLEFESGIDHVYFGDSHVEFFSRLLSSKQEPFYTQRYSIWVGPKTLLGLFYSQAHGEWVNKFNRFSKIFCDNRRKIDVFFSIGSIDIRASFFELLVRGTFSNEDELYSKFEEALEYFINEVILTIRSVKVVRNVCIFELFPCTLPGELPATTRQINVIRRSIEFPVFGTLEQRVIWTRKANVIMKSLCVKYDVQMLPTYGLVDPFKSEAISLDKVHMTSPNAVERLNRNIIKVTAGSVVA